MLETLFVIFIVVSAIVEAVAVYVVLKKLRTSAEAVEQQEHSPLAGPTNWADSAVKWQVDGDNVGDVLDNWSDSGVDRLRDLPGGGLVARQAQIPLHLFAGWMIFIGLLVSLALWWFDLRGTERFDSLFDVMPIIGIVAIWLVILPTMIAIVVFMNRHIASTPDALRFRPTDNFIDLGEPGVRVPLDRVRAVLSRRHWIKDGNERTIVRQVALLAEGDDDRTYAFPAIVDSPVTFPWQTAGVDRVANALNVERRDL